MDAARDPVSTGEWGARAQVAISAGYRLGLLGQMLRMHTDYYGRAFGFGAAFETMLAAEMAVFFSRLQGGLCEVWTATVEGRTVGTIAIDGECLGDGVAHLRWFIVGEEARGAGVGTVLIDTALAFVDRHGLRETRLWTFRGLDAARRLYERAGFELTGEAPGRTWGTEVSEQQFVRRSR